MKSYNNLYPQIAAFDRLYYARCKARRNKRYTRAAAGFEWALDSELLKRDFLLRFSPSPVCGRGGRGVRGT